MFPDHPVWSRTRSFSRAESCHGSRKGTIAMREPRALVNAANSSPRNGAQRAPIGAERRSTAYDDPRRRAARVSLSASDFSSTFLALRSLFHLRLRPEHVFGARALVRALCGTKKRHFFSLAALLLLPSASHTSKRSAHTWRTIQQNISSF